jgi:3-polyprenyl-4-hydroxybenzoate decarboxylase
MSQNLPAPCFQVYAANVLASLAFRKADLAARGLVNTLLCELWVNHKLPCSPTVLAKVLGVDAREIAAALPAAMHFFTSDRDSIYSPQLEDYRTHLNEIRAKQKTGGKKGADITNRNKKRATKHDEIEIESDTGKPQIHQQVHPQVEARVSSKAKSNTAKQIQTQPLVRLVDRDRFVDDYVAAEQSIAAKAYAKESGR